MNRWLAAFLFLLAIGLSCSSPPERQDTVARSEPPRRDISSLPPPPTLTGKPLPLRPVSPDWGRPKFTSYEAAIAWVRATQDRDDQLDAGRNSWITIGEYYLADGKGYLIVRTRKGEAILENVVPSAVWRDFKEDPSRERFKHMRERYRFELEH